MRTIGCLGAVAVAAALAPPASAGVVTSDGSLVRFRAHPGETNDVSVTVSFTRGDATGEARVSDNASPLAVAGRCTAVDAHSATCPIASEPLALVVGLRDGDDMLTVSGGVPNREIGVVLAGGPDNDSISVEALASPLLQADIVGHDGDDVLVGGRADEEFFPGPGNDVVRAGAGDDGVTEDAGDDRIDGGLHLSGTGDVVRYLAAPRRIVANLPAGRISGWGGDRVLGIEFVFGSRFADTLIGDAGEDWLSGEGGHDRLFGRGGTDVLFGLSGDDRLVGGAGNDALDGDAGRDALFGGPGRDAFFGGDGADRLFARDGQREHVDGDPGRDCANADSNDRLLGIEVLSCRPGQILTSRSSLR